MATLLGSLLIKLGIDKAELTRGLDSAEKQVRATTKRIEKAGQAIADVGAKMSIGITAPLVAFGASAFKAASDAAELRSAFDQTFGAMSKSMAQWAESTGNAMGRSTQEMQQAANTFGIFFNTAASPQKAAEMSKTFAKLAQDLGSFYNVAGEDAIGKLRSGLSGETEPLRDFGVFLTEASVKAEGLKMGLSGVGDELSEQEKILVRYNLILAATKNAQGDVERTSGGTANQIRSAQAAFQELQVVIGEKLLPVLTPIITRIADLLVKFSQLSPTTLQTVVTVAALAAAFGPLVFVVGQTWALMAALIARVVAAGGVMGFLQAAVWRTVPALVAMNAALGPIRLAILAIGAASAVFLLVRDRGNDAAKATATYAKVQVEAAEAARLAEDAANDLATATGKAREEALKNARALREETKEKLAGARASLIKAQAELYDARAVASKGLVAANADFGERVGRPTAGRRQFNDAREKVVLAQANEKAATEAFLSLGRSLNGLNRSIDAAEAPGVASADVGGSSKNKTKGGRDGGSGPSAEDIEQRFDAERASLGQRALAALASQAKTAEERAEYDLRSLELGLKLDRDAIKDDKDLSAERKKILLVQLERVSELERAQIQLDLQSRLESEAAEAAQQSFDQQRDTLQLRQSMAETEGERQRLALEMLDLDQQSRRQAIERVINSTVANDAEKERARRALADLDAKAGAERAAVSRQSETSVQRYMRDLNQSAAQVGEAIDGIRMDALDSLNSGLVDAITGVKSLGAVFRDVAGQIIADLLRIAIRQTIVKSLAGVLFGGGATLGAGPAGPANSLGGSLARIPGFANGTRFAPGGMSLVGERGPELVNLPRGSQVIPNRELGGLGGGGNTYNFSGNLLTPDFWARIQAGDARATIGGASLAQSQSAKSRKWALA